MSKQYIKDIIKEDYKNWNKGNLILIEAGTGSGKSYFIKNELKKYCKETSQNILYLTNRDILREQVKNDIGKDTNITVLNYQKIESFVLNGTLNLDNYDYIVMDEAHYFFTDSAFNSKTDLFLPRLLKEYPNICKIFMTATPVLLKKYLKKEKYEINYNYELKANYSYLDKIVCFNTYESIESIIEDIPKDEQIIFFSSAKRALEIAQKYNGIFICSKHNKDGLYDKYIKGTEEEPTENKLELQRIIETGTFKNHLLCCTTALDNGINIKENTPVKHIIIDILDRDMFLQCLGRKRVAEDEKINLYFYGWKNDNGRINGFKKKIGDSIDRAKLLFKEGEEVYVNTKFKNDKFVDGRIIDDVTINHELHKQVNKCVYLKYWNDLVLYNSLLHKKYPMSYKSMISCQLGIEVDEIIEMETNIKVLSLGEAFEREVGRKLYKEDRKELIEFVGLKDSRGRLQKSIGQLNEYLKANKLPYMIISKIDKRRKLEDNTDNPNRDKKYWEITKTIIE